MMPQAGRQDQQRRQSQVGAPPPPDPNTSAVPNRSIDSSGNAGRQGPAWGAPAQPASQQPQQGPPPPGPAGVPESRPMGSPQASVPQPNLRYGGTMGSPQAQAQPWTQATTQQGQQRQQQTQPQSNARQYYGEPADTGTQMMGGSTLGALQPNQPPPPQDYASMQAQFQRPIQDQTAPAPQPIDSVQNQQTQRRSQARSYYGEL